MTFAVLVIGIVAIILYNKGYSFERMIPYLVGAAAVVLFLPLVGKTFGAVIGGTVGIFGGLIGLVFGIVGTVIGLVFGILGIVLSLVFVVLLPLAILFVVFKAVA